MKNKAVSGETVRKFLMKFDAKLKNEYAKLRLVSETDIIILFEAYCYAGLILKFLSLFDVILMNKYVQATMSPQTIDYLIRNFNKISGNLELRKSDPNKAKSDKAKSVYTGGFVLNVNQEKGYKLLYNKNCWYKGEYFQLVFDGPGELVLPENLYYRGNFKNGKFEGKGCLQNFIENTTYEGQFSKGKYNGKGILKYANNTAIKGIFKESILVELIWKVFDHRDET
jgi:hypothetical protein